MCKGDEYRAIINEIKARLLFGELTYDEAKKEVAPIIAEMNQKGAEIAEKHKCKYRPFTFGQLMR